LVFFNNIQLAKELYKPITRKFKRRKVYVSNIDKIWSADIMDKSKLSKQNKGYKYLLNVDVYSLNMYIQIHLSLNLNTK